MAKSPTRAPGASPFAHLLSIVTGKSPKAEDEDRKDDADAEGDEDDTEAEDDKPDQDADSDKPDGDAEEGDGDDGAKGKRARGKRADKDNDADAAAEAKATSDGDDEEMAQARREGFEAAQARGRRIFTSASTALRPDMAAHYAFSESMPSAKAIEMLDMAASGVVPAEGGSRLHRRMARVVTPNPGSASGGKKPEEMTFGEQARLAAVKAGIIDA